MRRTKPLRGLLGIAGWTFGTALCWEAVILIGIAVDQVLSRKTGGALAAVLVIALSGLAAVNLLWLAPLGRLAGRS